MKRPFFQRLAVALKDGRSEFWGAHRLASLTENFESRSRSRPFGKPRRLVECRLGLDRVRVNIRTEDQQTPIDARKVRAQRHDLSYADLAEKLAAVGVKENEANIKNKINRGTFTAIFFVQCLEAIGCKTIHLDES